MFCHLKHSRLIIFNSLENEYLAFVFDKHEKIINAVKSFEGNFAIW